MSYRRVTTATNDWRIGLLNFDGVNAVAGVTPSGSTYILTGGVSAKAITIAAGVRVRAAGCVIRCDVLTLGANAQLDADGNADGTTSNMNSAAGDLFITIATGGASRTTTGVGNAGIGSGGNSMGSSAGAAWAAGAQTGNTTANTTTLSASNRNFFRSPGFLNLLRTQGNTTLAIVTGGQGGVGGSVDISAGGSATGPAGGSGASALVVRCRLLVMGANSRISARGGPGTTATAVAPGIASGSSPGGSGWVIVECEIKNCDSTASIDAYSGSTASGANGGKSSSLAPAGSALLWLGGKPAPRQRVMFAGDSKVVGFGNTLTVQVGGYRSWALDKKIYGNVPWLPVGEQLNGAFPNNEICGGSGEKVQQISDRLVTQAPAYLAALEDWPNPVVVVDIGTNDVTSGVPVEATSISQYSTLLNNIFSANANAIVFVCTLIDHQTKSAEITSYNAALTAMVTARAEYNVNLFMIDLRTAVGAWSATTYVDTTHLNEAGHLLAAAAIQAAWTAHGL